MNEQGEQKNYNIAKGDIINQSGKFKTGVDKSHTTYNVEQAGAVGPNSQNVVHGQQIWYQNKSELQAFLQTLKDELSKSSLNHEARNQANTQIATLESQLNSTNPDKKIIKEAGNVLYGVLLGVGGNLATKLFGLLTGLNL